MLEGMSLGLTPRQTDMFATTTSFVESRVSADSIYALLHRQCFELFSEEMFADLFTDVGRRSVPPTIVAVVMVLQRLEGCSDREAVERFTYDLRWKYAAGGLDFDYPGFVHTVLVNMRARLRESVDPDRIFRVTLEAAKEAGLVGRRRVLDSTALFDAVATMDTVTLIRSAIRGVLGACASWEERELRAVMTTSARGSRCATGRTAKRGKSSSTRSLGTRGRCSRCSTAASLSRRWRRPASCSRQWSGRTWSRVRTAGSGSRGRSRRIG